jgi:hypothetical protein
MIVNGLLKQNEEFRDSIAALNSTNDRLNAAFVKASAALKEGQDAVKAATELTDQKAEDDDSTGIKKVIPKKEQDQQQETPPKKPWHPKLE